MGSINAKGRPSQHQPSHGAKLVFERRTTTLDHQQPFTDILEVHGTRLQPHVKSTGAAAAAAAAPVDGGGGPRHSSVKVPAARGSTVRPLQQVAASGGGTGKQDREKENHNHNNNNNNNRRGRQKTKNKQRNNSSSNSPILQTHNKQTTHTGKPLNGVDVNNINNKNNRTSTGSRQSLASRLSFGSRSRLESNEALAVQKLPHFNMPEACNASAIRLKYITKRLKRDDIPRNDLLKNLEYICKVLDAAYKRESSRLCDEEDELSEVTESDVVPNEVKDWLTSTFTRSLTNVRRRGDERLKFRSVANAIRAGIVVDRLYRRMSSSAGFHVPPNVLLMMKNIDNWSFDVFQVNEIGENHALKYVGLELLQKYELINKFKINTNNLDNFLIKMEQGYSKHGNPYHNLVHAADVTQTTHAIITDSGLVTWLTDLEIYAVIFASMIHDYEHTGTTNAFHVNTGSEVALVYNDKAVLENHHVSAAFRLMRDDGHNILNSLSKEDYKYFRSLVIEIVLCTDMSFHFQQIKNMKNLMAMPEPIDKAKALSMIVHCADISHPSKRWELHLRWTEQLIEEFFRQGDKETELGLAISPLCDRKNTLIAESQIGFIDFIVDPSFQVMGDMLDKILGPLMESKEAENAASAAIPPGLERTDSSSSVFSHSSTSSTHSDGHKSPKPGRGSAPFAIRRCWVDCFIDNKLHWRERAVKEAETAKKLAEIAAAATAPADDDDSKEKTGDMIDENTVLVVHDDKETTSTDQQSPPEVKGHLTPHPPMHQATTDVEDYDTEISESELEISTACSSASSIHNELAEQRSDLP